MTIEELEKIRKKSRNIIVIGIIVTIIITLISIALRNTVITVITPIVCLIITVVINIKPHKKFILAFKDLFVLKSLKTIFTDLTYEPEKGIDRKVISDTKMMNMGDRYNSNDYVSGKYKNVSVEQSDIHIEERHTYTDSNGHTHTTWVTIFKGRWMIFDFNKTFKANIQVCQKGFGNSKRSNWGSKLKYKKVMMEDAEFNKNFKTYAQDEHDAFYVLTPSLMEKIKKLVNNIKGKTLFCFIDNKLHIAVDNRKDSFEHGVFKKINEEKITNEISQDIKLITNFVDELSLDNDLFRKEV